MIYGHFVIRKDDDPDYAHRLEVHQQPGTSSLDKAEAGLLRKLDPDRGFYFEFEPADGDGR